MCPAQTDFIDRVVIRVKAGDGGDGCISFHREKFVPRGGPDGGDGGNGGSIIFKVHPGRNTLESLASKPFYRAEDGGHGDKNDRHGRSGKDILLFVPPGTVVRDHETQELLVDMEDTEGTAVVAKGGHGGRGNARFATASRQVPRFAEPGTPGEEFKLLVELKTVAHVGLVGLPNAGKSTLLAAMTAARPRIAPYPFTTLHPILGTIPISDGTGLVVADIPGIIQGASEGLGLGLDFLRHIERTRMLVFVLELSPADPSFPAVTYQQLLTEIRAYDPEILTRPALIVLNKLDLLQEGDLEIILEEFIRETGVEQDQIHAVSALQGRNVPQLRETLIRSSGTLTQDQIAGDEERLS
ncbi:MAG TPA: GTPase ObgE [bacterium]|nr:GTPase ObgE [bacterium]